MSVNIPNPPMDPIKLLGDLAGSEISEVQFLPSSQAAGWVVLGWG